ncbi:hypothetical protein JW906_07445 [bacterium]|nr:hypothetical protein [bacterium]
MNAETTIVLCGGRINYSNLPVATSTSNAMVPVNGKPVIGWILDDLLAKGISKATIVLRAEDHRLKFFLEWAYPKRMDLIQVVLEDEGTIVESLQAGFNRSPSGGLVRIVLGDTLITDPFEGEDDFVYVGTVEETHRWCLAQMDEQGRIFDYRDKQEDAPSPYLALAGYYHLRHGDFLARCIQETISDGGREISHVLTRYGAGHPVYARSVRTWYDFGNIDRLVAARQQLLQSRIFNQLNVNPLLGTITKISADSDKLRDELDWYLNLPGPLQVLTPRILSHTQVNGKLQIVQEYYGYPTLAELYVYGDLHADAWRAILRRVLLIHREFRRYSGDLMPEHIGQMYTEKPLERLGVLSGSHPFWKKMLTTEWISLNGRRLRGWPMLEETVYRRSAELAANAPVSIIHGDYCFSNILFDVNNQIMRLIDPRGSFSNKGIYGDARYDVAKLRHSAHEHYDFILADLFKLIESGTSFETRIYTNHTQLAVGEALDRMLVEMNYDLKEIQFIEGLLFVSMLPLHREDSRRQKMLFLTGLSLLNEVL